MIPDILAANMETEKVFIYVLILENLRIDQV